MLETIQTISKIPLIETYQVTKYFPMRASLLAKILVNKKDQWVKAVDGVNLAIYQGETVGLVGESGCGKTTLGRIMACLHEPSSGQLFYQKQVIAGEQPGSSDTLVPLTDSAEGDYTNIRSRLPNYEPGVGEINNKNYHRQIQIIFQNPYSSLNPRKTVRDIVGVALRQRGVRDAKEREEETHILLKRVGLSERHIDCYPHQFSGGQRQRVGIARSLAIQPQFIVADEPVSALDVSIQAQIINLLQELQSEFNLTFLFISHDLSVVNYLSDRVAVMYLGHIMEEAETCSLFENPLHPYTKALLAAIPKVRKAERRGRVILEGNVPNPIKPPTGCTFHTRCFEKKLPACMHESPPEIIHQGHKVACWLYV